MSVTCVFVRSFEKRFECVLCVEVVVVTRPEHFGAMAAALNKTAIDEANRQLNGMYQQMIQVHANPFSVLYHIFLINLLNDYARIPNHSLSSRPLTHMCAQQEKKFKEELHEKEQEIVRLHTILRSTEMHMHEHRAASAAKEVELSVLRARLDQVS